MARKSAAINRKEETERQEPSLPDTLIPLSEVPEHQRSAYQIELIDNPEEFRKVVSSEDFFQMIAGFPQAWWGERLTMYLYRHEADDGIMVKNPQGEGNYIKPVIRQAVDRDWIANRNGGGKFQLWLNLSDPSTRRSTTIRKYTFRIDGPPLVKEGQIIEVGGKPISVSAAAPAPASDSRTDIATVIDASSSANKQNMDLLVEGTKTVISMVKDQAAASAVPAKDPIATAIELVKLLQPQQPAKDSMAAALEIVDRLDAMAARRNPAPVVPEPKDPPLQQAMDLAEQITGKPFADIFRGAKAATPDPYAWVAPVASIAQQVIAQLPTIIRESRIARDQEFKRQVWLRTAKPGEAPPRELTAENPPTPPPPPQPSPVPQAQPAQISANDLAGSIVQMVCHGFDNNPYDGEQTAAAIIFSLDKQIVALGLDKLLTDDANVHRMVEGNPILKERSVHALWPQFEAEFMGYMLKNYGPTETEADNDDEEDPRRSPTPMPRVPRNELPTGA